MSSLRGRPAKDTFAIGRLDEGLAHSAEVILLGEDPEGFVVGGVGSDEVRFAGALFSEDVVGVFGGNGVGVEGREDFAGCEVVSKWDGRRRGRLTGDDPLRLLRHSRMVGRAVPPYLMKITSKAGHRPFVDRH